jgi:hypothetical protein
LLYSKSSLEAQPAPSDPAAGLSKPAMSGTIIPEEIQASSPF